MSLHSEPAERFRSVLLQQLGSRQKMIKRRFYKLDHGDREALDPSSSSSSDSEIEAEAEVEVDASEEESEEDVTAEVKPNDDEAGSTSSGWFIHFLLTVLFVSFSKMCSVVLALT